MQAGTVLVLVALVSSIILVMHDHHRVVAMIAVVAAGIEALLVFGVISLSIASFRIDVILPALLLITGGIMWTKVSQKTAITCATLVTCVGAIQLLGALRIFA